MSKFLKSGLGAPPKIDEPKASNLTKKKGSSCVMMSFYVPVEFRRELKLYATNKDMSMVDVLKSAFEMYRKNNR